MTVTGLEYIGGYQMASSEDEVGFKMVGFNITQPGTEILPRICQGPILCDWFPPMDKSGHLDLSLKLPTGVSLDTKKMNKSSI